MNHQVAVQDMPVVGQQYVYILATHNRERIKIGRSIDPLDRITGLMTIYPELDLARSAILSVDSHRIENVVHNVFSDRREPLPSRMDGYTEWFIGDFAEEVIEFCHHISRHRGSQYHVISNVDVLLDNYRLRNPMAGSPAHRLTAAQLLVRQIDTNRRLRELASEHALQFIEVLTENDFNGLVCYGDQYHLVRSVRRHDEPECWSSASTGVVSVSDWGKRLAQVADVSIHIDGGSCCFRFIKAPIFKALDDQHGIEIYRLTEGPHGASSAGPQDWPDAPAFEILWDHLAKLEILEGFASDQHLGS